MIKRISLMRQVHQPDINTDADPNEKSRHCFAVAPNAIYYVLPTCIIYILAKANEKKHQEDEILYKKKKHRERFIHREGPSSVSTVRSHP